uniref:ARAD1B11528p n=1 Tax=Blastobotrys adeninivorans TaxID=409370 RepID=A0A060T5H6_BLAAD
MSSPGIHSQVVFPVHQTGDDGSAVPSSSSTNGGFVSHPPQSSNNSNDAGGNNGVTGVGLSVQNAQHVPPSSYAYPPAEMVQMGQQLPAVPHMPQMSPVNQMPQMPQMHQMPQMAPNHAYPQGYIYDPNFLYYQHQHSANPQQSEHLGQPPNPQLGPHQHHPPSQSHFDYPPQAMSSAMAPVPMPASQHPHMVMSPQEFYTDPNRGKGVKRSAERNDNEDASVKRTRSDSDESQSVKKLLDQEYERQSELLSPPEAMRRRCEALLGSMDGNSPVTYLAERFSDSVLLSKKENWTKYDPDEIQVAFSLATKYCPWQFWEALRDKGQCLGRIRNYLAELYRLKSSKAPSEVLEGLARIPLSTKQMEQYKFVKLLDLMSKKHQSGAIRKLAQQILENAIALSPGSSSRAPSTQSTLKIANAPTQPNAGSKPQNKSHYGVDQQTRKSPDREPGVKRDPKNSEKTEVTGQKQPKENKASKQPKGSEDLDIVEIKERSVTPKEVKEQDPKEQKEQKDQKAAKEVKKSTEKSDSSKKVKPATKPEAKPASTGGLFKSLQSAQTTQQKTTESKSKQPLPKLFSGPSFSSHLASLRGDKKDKDQDKPKVDGGQTVEKEPSPSAPKKKRKSVRWRDENLVEVKEFTPFPEEEAQGKLRHSHDAKMMDYHEATMAMNNREKEEAEEEIWYEPVEIDFSKSFRDPQSRDPLSIKRGGTKMPSTVECEVQKKREAHSLVAVYHSEEQIPPNPTEPDSSTINGGSITVETKTMLLSEQDENSPVMKGESSASSTHQTAPSSSSDTTKALTDLISQISSSAKPHNTDSEPPANNAPANNSGNTSAEEIQRILQMMAPKASNDNQTPGAFSSGMPMPNTNSAPSTAPNPMPNFMPNNMPGSDQNADTFQFLSAMMSGMNGMNGMNPMNFMNMNMNNANASSNANYNNYKKAPSEADLALRRQDVRKFVREDTTTISRYRVPCGYYNKAGAGCRRGDGCAFLHIN